jgi:hypothetical protein
MTDKQIEQQIAQTLKAINSKLSKMLFEVKTR